MNRFRHEPQLQTTVLGKMIERVRREHHLSTVTLAMLSGLSDAQIRAIEEGASHTFVDEAHRIDCARRIAIAMGLPETYSELQQRRSGSPMLIALILALLLAGLILGLSLLR